MTDLDGTPFRKAQTILGRRKKVVGSWFNYHWWTRTIAIGRWLADDADTAILLSTPEGNLSISALPVSLLAAKSIDETKIRGQESPEEDSSLLEFLDDGDNGEEEVSDETP